MVSQLEQINEARYEAYLRERRDGFVSRAGRRLGAEAIDDGAALLQGTFTLGLGMPETAPRIESRPMPVEHRRIVGSHALDLAELRIPHTNIVDALHAQEQKLATV